jgi:hypothetical protein
LSGYEKLQSISLPRPIQSQKKLNTLILLTVIPTLIQGNAIVKISIEDRCGEARKPLYSGLEYFIINPDREWAFQGKQNFLQQTVFSEDK